MLRLDEDALTCDMAETYHIFDLRALPVTTLARLSCGLRPNSRIKTKMRGDELSFTDSLLVAILDDLRWLRWSKTKNAQSGGSPPKPLLDIFNHKEEEKEVVSFGTPEEFLEKWQEINRR